LAGKMEMSRETICRRAQHGILRIFLEGSQLVEQSRNRSSSAPFACLAVALCSLALAVPAAAHEQRTVGAKGEYAVLVGWKYEPAFTGVMNAITITVVRAMDGRPINVKQGDVVDLEVEAQLRSGDQGSAVVESAPVAFKPQQEFGKDNLYVSWLLPTTAGTYGFRFKGTIQDKSDPKSGPVVIDVTFVCGDNVNGHHEHFACVKDPQAFPSGKAKAAAEAAPKKVVPSPGHGG
jgi:hypothetical protein